MRTSVAPDHPSTVDDQPTSAASAKPGGVDHLDQLLAAAVYGGAQLETFGYDAIGNPTGGSHFWEGSVGYGTAPAFNEVPSRSTAKGDQELFSWNADSRLATREIVASPTGKAHAFHYRYDGAGRLKDVELVDPKDASHWTYLDYDVDDQVVRERRTDGKYASEELYRFDGWRYEAVSGEVIESVLPMLKLVGDGSRMTRRWTHLEPDGHAVATYDSDGAVLSYEVGGAYGRALPDPYGSSGDVLASRSWWPIEGVHGLERDRSLGLVHAGARHFYARDGLWLQPEPLLHLGLWNADPAMPLGMGSVYAGGNPISLADRDGYFVQVAAPGAAAALFTAVAAGTLYYANDGPSKTSKAVTKAASNVSAKVGAAVAALSSLAQGDQQASAAQNPEASAAEGSTGARESASEGGDAQAGEAATKPKVKAKDRRAAEQAKSRQDKHGDEDWEEPASEGYAKWKAKQAEKAGGKEARREGHDQKAGGEGNRSKRQLEEDYGGE